MNAIVTYSDAGLKLAQRLVDVGFKATIHTANNNDSISASQLAKTLFDKCASIIYIGSLGICVRAIAPNLRSKKSDPAIVNIDVNGKFVQPVVSGHVGGANSLATEIAALIGAIPIITTVSDTTGCWSLDLLPKQFGWDMEPSHNLTHLMASLVNGKPTALLLEVKDEGTQHLEANLPKNVDVFYSFADLDITSYELVIAVTPFLRSLGKNSVVYRPKVLALGIGTQRNINSEGAVSSVISILGQEGLAVKSISSVGSIDIKHSEQAIIELASRLNVPFRTFSDEVLSRYNVPNPSQRVEQKVGCKGVAEASAMHISENNLLVEKQKHCVDGKYLTLSVAIHRKNERKGFVEIVGAGPGDPKLVTVRGKELLQAADLILYAGSLVPKELTTYAKAGCVVRSSADMDLQQQVDLMEQFYSKGLLVVRLHTGDPCIYGAIQEQMHLMDQRKMAYRITPGVSSFQAAAAALKSQFTIPEEVQTIILTRGEGRTPVPEREHLKNLARSQSTMCIYLSASIAGKIQAELLEHYPPDTPVAICYKLTWKDEKIWRCALATLEQTVVSNKLSMTTLIVVGKAIDNRAGESKLYDKNFSHAFRL